LNNEKYTIGLKETDPREVDAWLARVDENLRFVERGRLVVPEGADQAMVWIYENPAASEK